MFRFQLKMYGVGVVGKRTKSVPSFCLVSKKLRHLSTSTSTSTSTSSSPSSPARSMDTSSTVSPLKHHFLRLAEYHHWATSNLIQQLSDVSEEDYRKDIGLFFHSIHGTLNHILLADRIWFGRYTSKEISFKGLDQEVEADRNALGEALLKQAMIWMDYINSLEDDDFQGQFSYRDSRGGQMSRERGALLDHVFNHGTHHRGQITAALTILGYKSNPGIDLLYYIHEKEKKKG